MPHVLRIPPLTVDGRQFPTWKREPHSEVILEQLTADDLNWALSKLGQYVDGEHPESTFRAYVAEVSGGTGAEVGRALLVLEDIRRRS